MYFAIWGLFHHHLAVSHSLHEHAGRVLVRGHHRFYCSGLDVGRIPPDWLRNIFLVRDGVFYWVLDVGEVLANCFVVAFLG